MKKILTLIAAAIMMVSCQKQAKENFVQKNELNVSAKKPVSLTQQELTKVIGNEAASKVFNSVNAAAKGKPQGTATVVVWFDDLVLTGVNADGFDNLTTTLPSDPNFAGIQWVSSLLPSGAMDFSSPGTATTSWWEAGIGFPFITTYAHAVNAGEKWYYRSWSSDMIDQVHISGITTIK